MTSETGIQEKVQDQRKSAGSEITVNALAIISTELMETIRNAHLALEDLAR